MELREDPPDSVIEETAGILAAGYLRLCMVRHASEFVVPLAETTEEQVDGTPVTTKP
jgi:hypothetical protein